MLEAVVAIFVYKNEIFSIQRQNYLKAFPGYYSFPGGKIDQEDYEFSFQHPLIGDYPIHEMGALFREIDEELNYSIRDAIDKGNVTEVSKLGTAITPPFEKYRFNAHYYKIVLNNKPELIADDGEILSARWLSKVDLNNKYHSGKSLMVVPTVRAIERLLEDISIKKIENLNLEYDLEKELPNTEMLKGVGCIYVPSNTLPPADTTNSLLLGDEGSLRIITDPSPESDDIYNKLVSTLEKYKLDSILLTHHHPDHHERAPQLARQLKLPILCSKITEQRLLERYGAHYLDDIKVSNIAQNDKITKWLGKNVIYHE
ncbi:MAG: ribonuclease/clavin/mitogillin [Cocleimonas sp.]|jgi:ribonuclease/clavin/mitogillin